MLAQFLIANVIYWGVAALLIFFGYTTIKKDDVFHGATKTKMISLMIVATIATIAIFVINVWFAVQGFQEENYWVVVLAILFNISYMLSGNSNKQHHVFLVVRLCGYHHAH